MASSAACRQSTGPILSSGAAFLTMLPPSPSLSLYRFENTTQPHALKDFLIRTYPYRHERSWSPDAPVCSLVYVSHDQWCNPTQPSVGRVFHITRSRRLRSPTKSQSDLY
jgi:hypothetical protein